MKNPSPEEGQPASKLIESKMENLSDWRGPMFKRLRGLIKQADPEILEELKWKKPSNPMGVPVYSCYGLICHGIILKSSVRVTFFKGALLKDPSGLFNGGFNSNRTRWIDIHEGDKVNEVAMKRLLREAVALNLSNKSKRAK